MNGERVSREFHSLVSIAFSRVTAELTLKIRRVDETNPNFGNKATRSIRVRVLSLALFLSLVEKTFGSTGCGSRGGLPYLWGVHTRNARVYTSSRV